MPCAGHRGTTPAPTFSAATATSTTPPSPPTFWRRQAGQAADRLAILDIDYHHGNGTQAFFQADPNVWYGSLHIDPAIDYPFFAGYADETGEGPGTGTVCNMPLAAGTSQPDYLASLASLCERVAAFSPRWLILSAGFDTYIHDPIATFQITTSGYGEIGALIAGLNLPTLIVQEGGYHLPHLGLNLVSLLQGLGTADG